MESSLIWIEDLIDNITKFGDIPRATDDPPIVYSRIKAHPISQATLATIFEDEEQRKVEQETTVPP